MLDLEKALAQGAIWLEGETPTSTSQEIQPTSWAGVMSGDKWLQVSIEAADAEKRVPETGIVLGYDFNVTVPGKYQIWNRIGFEFVRSPFDWRIDGLSDWKTVTSDEITTDLTEIGFWAEVAWLKLGDLPLSKGKHTLQIRLQRTYDAQHKVQRILYASDALCLTNAPVSSERQVQTGRQLPGNHLPTPSPVSSRLMCLYRQLPAQTSVSLKGVWQFARWDETLVKDRTGPISSVPRADELNWYSMQVPGDRNKMRPDMTFAHRYFLRTRVDIPSELAGRSIYLHIPRVNFIATLFVNGKQVASSLILHMPYGMST